jgi:hypothetical protein
MAEEKKLFTFEEARKLIPVVHARTRAALDALSGVEVPADAGAEAVRERMERAAGEILGAWAKEMEAMGIEVKGPWLVDFDSGAGYWCWKWPEESLEFFHDYETGFAGRVRIQ